MNRYVVFVFDSYEASGGWNDVLTKDSILENQALVFNTIKEACATGRAYRSDYFHVVDLDQGLIVADQENEPQ